MQQLVTECPTVRVHLKVDASLTMCVHAPSGLLARLVTRKPTAVASAIARTTERASITTSVNATTAGRESAAIATRAKPSATAAITARASA